MPKLKLKQKNEIGVGIKSVKQTNVRSFKNDQEQSKLSKFFTSSQEDDAVGEKNPKKVHVNEDTTSKFFKELSLSLNTGEMDESVSDFKPESKSKRIQSKPANDTKISSKGKKPSKNAKHPSKSKGGKQNLHQYNKEFDQVCAIGGVDVDPEHLQLAIALSRSLSDFQGSSDMNDEIPSTSLEYETEDDKVKRIRKTLDQYGFKVPVGPISLKPIVKVKRKRLSKKITNSPLLTRSLEEKKQITSNIVSQILFECLNKNCGFSEETYDHLELDSTMLNEVWAKNSPIFTKARLKYVDMKEFDIFYVKNLITPSDSNAGCLLKDWSKIPGRDPSPDRTVETLDFRETALFTNYFDDLLSSTIPYIREKMSEINVASPTKSTSSPSPSKPQTTQIHDSGICTTINNSISNKSLETCKDNVIEVIDNDSRSCSPDIFEDSYAEDEINVQCVSDKNYCLKLACAEMIHDSSDDELPNVYMSQPRKNETFVSPLKLEISPPNEISKNINCTDKSIGEEIDNSIDLTQDNYFLNKPAENFRSCNSNTEGIITTVHSDSGKDGLENSTIINDIKICEDVENTNVIDDLIDLTQNNYSSIKPTEISYSFEFNNEDIRNKYSKCNSIDSEISKIKNNTTINITENSTASKDIGLDEISFEKKKLLLMSPFETNVTIREHNETLKAIKESYNSNNVSALQHTDSEFVVHNTLKMNKPNNISLGSINDSIQFDQILKDFRSNQFQANGDCYSNEDKESTVEDSVDLTEEDNLCAEDCEHSSAMNISSIRNFSQIYETDNGIVHFESYCEENEPLDVSGTSDSSLKERNDLMINKRKNINDISLSSPERSKNKSNNTGLSTDSIFENSINDSVHPISFDNKDIDLTQSSNDSSYSHSLTRDKKEFSNKFQHDNTISDVPMKSDDVVMNVSYEEKHSEKVLSDSFNDNSAVNDVFVISDEEFNYSIGINTTKRLDNSKIKSSTKIYCGEISKSDDESSDVSDVKAKNETAISLDVNILPKFNNEYNKSKNDLNTTEQDYEPYIQYRISNKFDLYGSSIFDQIPSCNSSLVNNLNNENFKDITNKQKSLITTDIESFSARYYPQSSDLTQPETMLNCSEDLPNVYLKNHQKETSEVIQNAIDEDSTVNTVLVKNSEAKETPETCKYTVKTDNVTPAQNYSAMDTPHIHKELSKFGLKPLKRKRAVQMLEHIYSQTHPIVNTNDLKLKLKRRKIQYNSTVSESVPNSSGLNKSIDPAVSQKENVLLDRNESRELNVASIGSPLKCAEQAENILKEPVTVQYDNLYNPDSIKIDIKQIECDPADWIFQNKEKAKVLGCRVPLHIAFHNYLSVRSKLKDAILRYDPVNIDVIHKGLVADGYKYNSKDLFHFMDKKCITIKTADKTRGARQHQKGK